MYQGEKAIMMTLGPNIKRLITSEVLKIIHGLPTSARKLAEGIDLPNGTVSELLIFGPRVIMIAFSPWYITSLNFVRICLIIVLPGVLNFFKEKLQQFLKPRFSNMLIAPGDSLSLNFCRCSPKNRIRDPPPYQTNNTCVDLKLNVD
jgi:hypothetical protein